MDGIIKATDGVLAFLRGIPLSDIMIGYYQRSYQGIQAFCTGEGVDVFDDICAERFIDYQRALHEGGAFGPNKFRQMRKAASLLADHMHGRELTWKRNSYQNKLNGSFGEILALYTERLSQNLAQSTCEGMVSVARQFLAYLERGGAQSIGALSAEDVKGFMQYMTERCPNSMKHVVFRLKRFASFISASGLAEINADRYLARPAPRHVRLYPCFTDDEAAAILDAVDRSTPLGKRDYAILKIALGTGLRCSDILDLRRSDIDWERKEINVLVSKTNTYAQIPLLTDVGNAVAEYILYARPKSESPHIFLRSRMPHGRLLVGCDIVNRYLARAGIQHEAWDGKSFHAFRRTAGTRLVRANVPLPVVAQALIHSDMDSAKRYVALDDDTLRVCCLGISEHPIAKEGLA